MSVEACAAFLELTQDDPAFAGALKAVTDSRELLRLGRRNGYTFDLEDVVAASSAMGARGAPRAAASRPAGSDGGDSETSVSHFELDLRDVPALRPAAEELARLTIKPGSVDLDAFRAAYRQEDLDWTSMSPAAPGFGQRYEEVMRSHWIPGAAGDADRRDFHLVNLDEHVDHPLYDEYFEAKRRTVGHLERAFSCEIRFSGSMWYPPFSYRLWHTNETQPGWRMYLVDFDEEIAEDDMRSFFRYMNPQTSELVTLRDRPRMLRIFKVDQRPDRLLWHCIVNGADRHRWSFGFAIPDDWMARLGVGPSTP